MLLAQGASRAQHDPSSTSCLPSIPQTLPETQPRVGDLLCQHRVQSRVCLGDQRLNLSFIIYKQRISLNFWQLLSQGSALPAHHMALLLLRALGLAGTSEPSPECWC